MEFIEIVEEELKEEAGEIPLDDRKGRDETGA